MAGAAAQRLPRGTPPTIQLNRSITGVQLSTLANELVGVKKVQDFVIAEGVEDKLVADFITLLQVEKIVGNLEIRGSSIVGVVFSKVKQIGRLVARDNGNMLSLTFPKLTRIDQDMLVENNVALQSVHCPLLEAVGGALTLRLLPALSVVGMPRLATLGGNLVVDECSSLRSLCQLGLRAGGMNPSAAVGITRSPKITRGDPEIFRKAKIYAIEECRGVQIEVRSFDDFTNVQRVYNTSLGITVDVGDVTLAWNAMKTVHLGQLLQRVTVIYGDLVITGASATRACVAPLVRARCARRKEVQACRAANLFLAGLRCGPSLTRTRVQFSGSPHDGHHRFELPDQSWRQVHSRGQRGSQVHRPARARRR